MQHKHVLTTRRQKTTALTETDIFKVGKVIAEC